MVNSTAVAAIPVAFSVIQSPEVFGNIALALRMSLVPVAFSNTVFSPILLSTFIRAAREGRRAQFSSALKATNAKLIVASSFALAVMVLSKSWFSYAYSGQQWSLAPICLAILGPLTAVQMFVSPRADLLFVARREKVVLLFDGLRILLSISVALALTLADRFPLAILASYVCVSAALFLWFARAVTLSIGLHDVNRSA
jgi:O-antigen/teichoic acid export membrane protein